jgi:hypothetical protein
MQTDKKQSRNYFQNNHSVQPKKLRVLSVAIVMLHGICSSPWVVYSLCSNNVCGYLHWARSSSHLPKRTIMYSSSNTENRAVQIMYDTSGNVCSV